MTKDFSDKVKNLREKYGFTMRELAELLGFSESTISQWESGKIPPKKSSVILVDLLYEKLRREHESIDLPVTSEISAGKGMIPDDRIEAYLSIPLKLLEGRKNLKTLCVVRVRGNSMEPTFRHGDFVIVDYSKDYIDIDGIYVITIDNEVMIKRVAVIGNNKLRIISDNPQYGAFEVDKNEVIVNGKVVMAVIQVTPY